MRSANTTALKAAAFAALLCCSIPSQATGYWFWNCLGTAGVVQEFPSNVDHPTCTRGYGEWVRVEIYDPTAYSPQAIADQLEIIGVNSTSVTYAFAWGFGLYIAFWSLGFAAELALKAIKTL